ncbi:MAG: TrbG/VirB9 family P-type conjugative transfer protein [Campylobacteraceae bacterium]|jgi:type IV secretion system protein VirB9|nr:TrbG/VirB9 family P-type conjugative transfer protein [Campylobacteraceae bacterium]
MKKIVISVMFLMFVTDAFAAVTPESSPLDKRITYQIYSAKDVVKIYAKDGYVTVLELDKEERVIDMFTGFVDGWDLTDKGSFVFIKPKAFQGGSDIITPKVHDWDTNLILTTTKRVYVVDLVLVEKEQPIYKVTFSYPDKAVLEKQQAQLQLEQIEQREREIIELQAQKEEEDHISTSLDKLNSPRNWNLFMKVNKYSQNIAPVFAYEDGIFTYLGFDNTKSIPSVYLWENGKESILNTHMKEQGEYQILVIHKIAPKIILRAGDKVVGILNGSFGENPAPQRTTISSEIFREVLGNAN